MPKARPTPRSANALFISLVACAITFVPTAQGCRGESPGTLPPKSKPVDNSRWMEEHLEAWGKRPLKQWVLPASHDSAMYESGWMKSLAKTQDLAIYEQLAAGIRYFDLRPKWSDGQISMHHGPVLGPALADVLDDVRRFCREPHRELIILKFSHYEAFSNKAYRLMTDEIAARLDPWLSKSLPAGKRLAEVPLRDLLREKSAVWVVCDGGYPLAVRHPGIWVYRDWSAADAERGDLRVYDRYANSTDYRQMKADQFDKFAHYDGKCLRQPNAPCDLFLLSWTLTPATNVRAYAELPNRNLADDMKDLQSPNRFGCIVNLLYADYADTAHLTDLALEMNRALENRGGKKDK